MCRRYVQGQEKGVDVEGRAIRQGFKQEEVEPVLAEGGRLPVKRSFGNGWTIAGPENIHQGREGVLISRWG
ncbi:MAG: hypothetical protein A2340_11475 [Lentisphaerae bacterium RIFOXYB12_FULL_60_10]|nr:MAG: hypothetical protein A2340_11475 [Lentisphaerae bacterium RIFOXYB12_FULL_60_10]